MGNPLKLLIVEDNEIDALLIQRTLEKGGYTVTCEVVETPAAMRVALKIKKNWDIIISDRSMPYFNGPEAIAIAKELCPEVPVIILSGEFDNKQAESLLSSGALVCIHKNEMALILPVIKRKLDEVNQDNIN